MITIQNLAFYGVIIEVVLILTILALVILFKILRYFQYIRKENILANIENNLKQHMKNKTQVTPVSFSEKYRILELLLYVVNKFDTENNGADWQFIRTNFIREILLPLARTATDSTDWRMRHYAAQAFTLYSENKDQNRILKLINDDIPLVRYSASSAGILHGTEKVFSIVIRRMSQENWQTQTLYLQAFDNIPAATHYFIDRIMLREDNPEIRSTCYNLLLRYPVFKTNWDIMQDVKSKDIKLALASVRFLAYSQPETSINELHNLLNHQDWRMRAVAISALGDIKAENSIMKISAKLKDISWWVRFSARQALPKFGVAGSQELVSNRITTSRINIDVSQQLLSNF